MPSDNNLKIIFNMMAISILSLLLGLTACPENPENSEEIPSDTTSHNFTWEIDTLGDYSGYLNDVWIADENNIWVVGEIIMHDSDSSWNGTGFETFNAAHWNGEKWEYIHIRGNLMNDVGPLYSIWYFDDSNIWVSTGFPVHWDGVKWTLYHLQNMGIDASAGYGIWASSPSNIYFVGYKGSIVHYNGKGFEKMESGTDLNLRDVYGSGKNVYTVGHSNSSESIALEFVKNTWRTKFFSTNLLPFDSTNILGRIYSVCCTADTLYIAAVGGIWKESMSSRKGKLINANDTYIKGKVISLIRANLPNDILMVDLWGEIIHFNGKSWYLDSSIYHQYPDGQVIIRSMAFKNDLSVLVGCFQFHCLIIRGYRMN